MPAILDHVLWGAPDLEHGVDEIARIFGVKPAYGGEHPGLGTRNALLSAGEGLYFEVIAPDPAQPLDNTLGGYLAALPRPELFTYAVRRDGLEETALATERLGLDSSGVVNKQRTTPDGTVISWDMLVMSSDYGGALPFVIDWQGSQHPGEVTPKGCRIRSFRVAHPRADELRQIYRDLDIDIEVARSPEPRLIVQLDTPNGEAWVTGSGGVGMPLPAR